MKFTPDDVAQAYREKKLTPRIVGFGLYLYYGAIRASDDRCCAIGALLVGEQLIAGPHLNIESEFKVRFPELDMWSFVSGFDDNPVRPTMLNMQRNQRTFHQESYDLGAACRERVLPVLQKS